MKTHKRFLQILILSIFVAATLCLINSCIFDDDDDGTGIISYLQTRVATNSGVVHGALDNNNTYSWKGIPYAAPPVDDLRWKAPQDPQSWSSTLETTEFSELCPQVENGVVIGSEDCLYLNIWSPQDNQGNLPVLFWIHGGGNYAKFPGDYFYDGSNLASDLNIIMVTINYRLGILGWLTHPSLRHGESAYDDSGNFGTLDMVKALTWVRDNIEKFGGDPNNVTIGGDSWGGGDVCSLLISPDASGLFHKGISISGGLLITSVESGEDYANLLLENLLANDGFSEAPGNDVEAYLRSKTSEELLSLYSSGALDVNGFKCVFNDGTVIPENGIAAVNDPTTYTQVPLMLGNNAEEYKLFIYRNFENYPTAKGYQDWAEFWTRMGWKAYVDNLAGAITALPRQPPVYAFEFDYGRYRYIYDVGLGDIVPDPNGYNAWPTDYNGRNYALMMGACHFLGLPFFFDNVSMSIFEPLSNFIEPFGIFFREENMTGAQALSYDITAYLSEFLYNDDPGDAGGVLWEPWSNDPGAPKRIIFDANDTESIIEMSYE